MNTNALPAQLRVALLGNPNCGKTALFNLLTGSRQKVANYAGVTVERKEGLSSDAAGRPLRVLDLPGAYSLHPLSEDERITLKVVQGLVDEGGAPDVLVCVTDATNLALGLRMVLQARSLGRPMIVALNMSDVAQRRGIHIDRAVLERELGCPVVETVAVRRHGAQALREALARCQPAAAGGPAPQLPLASAEHALQTQQEVRRVMAQAVSGGTQVNPLDDHLDRVLLHPVAGMLGLLAVLFVMFQAVFSWAQWPMDAIKAGVELAGNGVNAVMADGPLRSLLVEGVIAGVGGVLVFLPQILILFLFILALEDCGYLPRAAFLLDRTMAAVGLSGRSFIPLLSSFACAVPGIMATRTIADRRDRLVTILIAPLMTCSARLPVYALLIGAFIPRRQLGGVVELQGLVLFVLYLAGILSAMAVAWVLKRARSTRGPSSLLMELPGYRLPRLAHLGQGLLERAKIFLQRVGSIILSLTIVLWFVSSYPAPPAGATGPAIQYSIAGIVGRHLAPLFEPLGFNWQITVALIPGLAAREVAVSALATVYALAGATPEAAGDQLAPVLSAQWPLATALALMAWYIFAPQCLSTVAAIRRETNSWRYPALMAGYLFALAYGAAWLTHAAALRWLS